MKHKDELHYMIAYEPTKNWTAVRLTIRMPPDFEFGTDNETHGAHGFEDRLLACVEGIAMNRGFKRAVSSGDALWDEFEEPGTMGDPGLVEFLTGYNTEDEDEHKETK